jgi:microcystin-dependent protein
VTPDAGATCTVGQLTLFTAYLYPTNWLPADGRTLQATEYEQLFLIIDYNYGGSGANFKVPDLRAAAPNNTQYLICVTGTCPQ